MESPILLPKLRKAFRQVGDPVKAPVMQAYMKSAMPYHGVPTPFLRDYPAPMRRKMLKYVRLNRTRLSALSCREALKNIQQ
jgi:3-methyladenine DNA glycosylase AlkD